MRCASCDVDLNGARPTIVDGAAYCCAGCAGGGPCTCSYEEEHLRLARYGLGWRVQVRDLLDRYERTEFS